MEDSEKVQFCPPLIQGDRYQPCLRERCALWVVEIDAGACALKWIGIKAMLSR